MTTLNTAPLASLLEQLFQEADAATSPAIAATSREDRERMMRSKTEYIALYSLMKDLWLPVSRETGVLLTATSNEAGLYRFLFLNPGKYKMVATISGFKTFERENIQLSVNESDSTCWPWLLT